MVGDLLAVFEGRATDEQQIGRCVISYLLTRMCYGAGVRYLSVALFFHHPRHHLHFRIY